MEALSDELPFGRAFAGFAGKRVLITGHTGFKGSWLTLWLTSLGAKVTGFALAPEGERSHFDQLGLAKLIDHNVGDIRDLDALQLVMRQAEPDIVIHLAAQALVRRSYADPVNTFTTNMTGSANLLEAVKHCGSVRSLVFITSDKCYDNKEWAWGYRETDELGGKDPYSASKAAAELVFRAYYESYFSKRENFGCVTTRAGNVIGGGDWSADRLVPDCIRALEKGSPIVIRNPRSTRPWQFVLEPLSGYMQMALALLDQPARYSGGWNFGPGGDRFMTVGEVAQDVVSRWGAGELRIEIDPNANHEAGLLHLSIDKVVSGLGWRPVYSGAEAVKVTTEWYKRNFEGVSAVENSTRQIQEYVVARTRA